MNRIFNFCTGTGDAAVRWFPSKTGQGFRTLIWSEKACIWLHRFEDRDQAFQVIAEWIDRYHTKRPHAALGYKTPAEFTTKLAA